MKNVSASTVRTSERSQKRIPAATFQTGLAKAALWLVSVLVLLGGGAATVYGQSALDGFDPNANGTVQVIVPQPDGKILIGGSFTTLAPNGGVSVTRNRIARLNADGTLDTGFNPNASGAVLAIAVQADGKILVGGSFTNIGGLSRSNIARLDAVTGLADSWNPNSSGPVNPQIDALVVQTDGKILAGGLFTSIGGQTRTNIARLDPTTGSADSFNPNADDQVTSIAVQADARIVVGGRFLSIGGAARSRIARLDANMGLADSWNPNANSVVTSIAIQADGKILAGGFFQSGFGTPTIGGATRNRIARLDPTTGLADSFNPNANNFVRVIAIQADGKILVGGDFTGASSIGGATRNNLARLDPVTGAADSFNANVNSLTVFGIAVQSDGKILAGGIFTSIGGEARNRIARLETDGRADRTLNASIDSFDGDFPSVYATAVQSDGKILIGGIFEFVSGVGRMNLARLNTDGALDTFSPNPQGEFPGGNVSTIALQADGKILVGGSFTSIGGQARHSIARLDPNGAVDMSFDPDPGQFGSVGRIAVQADGKILVGGSFSIIGGQGRNNIARLNPSGVVDTAFNPNANGHVGCIAVQPDGKVLIGGNFTSIGGQARTNIARLDATTGLPDTFNPNANGAVLSLVVQPDGKILVGGGFTSIGGQTRTNIARLDATSGLPDTFSPNARGGIESIGLQADGKILVSGHFSGANSIGGQFRNYIARLDPATGLADSFNPSADGSILCMAVQADGKILAGGTFQNIGGQVRTNFARLLNDSVAGQNLTVAQTTVSWIRSGSSPQFGRVTFEDSTDGASYNFLGTGTAAGNNWTLTGLNLSLGQNLFIRARGHYSNGNRAESIQETARNTVVIAQPLLNIQRSGNTDVVLSWTTNFTGFTLQANTNLNTNLWSVVSPAPVVSGANNVVTNAATEAKKYYRLSKP